MWDVYDYTQAHIGSTQTNFCSILTGGATGEVVRIKNKSISDVLEQIS